MADAKTSKKKYAGQTALAWGLELGGAAFLFFLYRWYKQKQAAKTTTTAGGSIGVTYTRLVDALEGSGTYSTAPKTTGKTTTGKTTGKVTTYVPPIGTVTPTSILPTTFSEWVNRALKAASIGTATAYDAITAWQNGQCVSHAGYSFLSTMIAKLGLPPDGINYPLLACATSTTGGSGGKTSGTGGTKTTTGTKSTTPITTLASKLSTVTLGGVEYYVLGEFDTAGEYVGANVGTGAPVYFTWTGNGTPTQGPPPATAKGVVAYTPTSTPARQIGNYNATGEVLFPTEHLTGSYVVPAPTAPSAPSAPSAS